MSSHWDDLSAFRDVDATLSQAPPVAAQIARDVLLFEYAGDLYGVEAVAVVGVVPWRSPAPVPGVDSRVHGVIQDRGRVVVLLRHPTCQANARPGGEPTRIVVCTTARGHVGLPALSTKAVGRVELACEPSAVSVYESAFGPFIYLDPTRYGDQSLIVPM